jgi:acyl-CoA hydrolase
MPFYHLYEIIMIKDPAILERLENSQARITKAIFPFTTNHHDTLFGGQALSWMDEAAFIAATRFCRKRLVTVSSDRIDFKHPIPGGSLVELVGQVVHVGRTSLKVEVNIYVEDMYHDHREKAITGTFSFVAVDSDGKPTPVLPV